MTGALDISLIDKGNVTVSPPEHDVTVTPPEHEDDRRARIQRESDVDKDARLRDRTLFFLLIASYCISFGVGLYLLLKNDFSVDTPQGRLGWLFFTNLLTLFLSALSGFKIGQKSK